MLHRFLPIPWYKLFLARSSAMVDTKFQKFLNVIRFGFSSIQRRQMHIQPKLISKCISEPSSKVLTGHTSMECTKGKLERLEMSRTSIRVSSVYTPCSFFPFESKMSCNRRILDWPLILMEPALSGSTRCTSRWVSEEPILFVVACHDDESNVKTMIAPGDSIHCIAKELCNDIILDMAALPTICILAVSGYQRAEVRWM